MPNSDVKIYEGTIRVKAFPQKRNPDGAEGYSVQPMNDFSFWVPKGEFHESFRLAKADSN